MKHSTCSILLKPKEVVYNIKVIQNRKRLDRGWGSQPVTYGSEWKTISNESKFSCGGDMIANRIIKARNSNNYKFFRGIKKKVTNINGSLS